MRQKRNIRQEGLGSHVIYLSFTTSDRKLLITSKSQYLIWDYLRGVLLYRLFFKLHSLFTDHYYMCIKKLNLKKYIWITVSRVVIILSSAAYAFTVNKKQVIFYSIAVQCTPVSLEWIRSVIRLPPVSFEHIRPPLIDTRSIVPQQIIGQDAISVTNTSFSASQQ